MENCLQIADHWITIISGVFTIVFTLIATWLAWKTFLLSKNDKQKTIAINELQEHTKKLENIYLNQIQPKFVVKIHANDYVKILNIGGDCYNLKIDVIGGTHGKSGNPFESWDDFFSSSTEKKFNYMINSDRNYSFNFEDSLGNKFEQILYTSKRKFSNLIVKTE